MASPEPNFAVDISETFDIKLAALRAHASQVGARMDEIEPRLRQWATDIGAQHNLPMAELFHRAENP
jgi:LmbE family N-acetylglucosaminyl deacetylase